MPWVKLTEDTYYHPGATNIGYHRGVIIDSGESVAEAEKMALELEEMGLEIRWLLNTHGHPDHCGGNAGFMKHGAKLIACDYQSSFMMNMKLPSHFMYSAELRFGEQREFRFPHSQPVYPDRVVRPGVLELDGMEFILESHCGHAIDQISILTPDNVLFIGDILLPMVMVRRSSMPITFSAISQEEDLRWLKTTQYSHYVPGHGKPLTAVTELAAANEKLMRKFIDEVLSYCIEARTREEIAAHCIQKYGLSGSMSGCSVVYNAVGAYIMYLEDTREMTVFTKKGYTYYKSTAQE